jgi:hypothetical protein
MTSAPAPRARRETLFAGLVAIVLTAGFFALVGRVNFNATEEGYLWYGALRTAAGEVPLRDFQSYDPGRYYWCAILGGVFGHGVLGLRLSVACFQALGMFFGLLAARRALKSSWSLIPTGLFYLAWMFPRHKLFESAIALTAVFFAVRLLERPNARRHFEAGAFVGLAGFFGRNHAAYCAAGIFCLWLVLAWRQRSAMRSGQAPGFARRLASYTGGILAGYSPMLLMLVFVPGYAAGFWNSILVLFKLGVNIPHPWPWPWTYRWSDLSAIGWLENLGKAFWFTVPVVLFPAGIVTLVRTPVERFSKRAVFLAGSILGLFYIHHASVRSDPSHFAQSIDPLLVALVGLPAAFSWGRPRVLVAGWCLVALLTVGSVSATHQLLSRQRFNERPQLVDHSIAGDTLRMHAGLAEYYTRIEKAIRTHVPDDAQVFFAPSRPGFYGIFDKVSPTWWIYFFVPELDAETQNKIVGDLADIEWAFLVDVAIAGQERFLLRNTSPSVWEHLRRDFQRVNTPGLPENHILLRRNHNPLRRKQDDR